MSEQRGAAKILIVAVAITLGLVSCGWYFTSDIAGYIKDSESDDGINGAIIRIYLEEPEAADSDGFIVETASARSSSNDGYFNHRVIWQNLLPSFGEEGDSNSLWLGIAHEDYLSAVVEIRGILSDTLNLVPDISLDRAGFSSPLVTGSVVDPSGEGINGVRVVLDIPTTEDDEEDYVTVTTTIDEIDGRYEFTDVSWRDDEAAGTGSDTEDVTIFIDDNEYASPDELTVVLSSDQEIEVRENITAASDEFSVPRLWGRVLDVGGNPLNGIRVVLDLHSTRSDDEDENESEDYVAITRTIDDVEGTYEFNNVSWIDEAAREALSLESSEEASITIDDGDYTFDGSVDIELDSDVEYEVTEDIRASYVEFTVERVWGTILDVAGEPLNGVRVVLDLASTDGDDETDDYIATTGTVDGEEGIYEFNNVTWTDETALGDITDIESAELRVDDNDYETATTVSVDLQSGQEQEIDQDITVNRADPTEFQTRITGRCLTRTGTAPDIQELPARGIEVSCSFEDEEGTYTLYDQTDANGTYTFVIQWIDTTRGDFDEGTADDTIPAGEDGIIVEIAFATPFDGASFIGATSGGGAGVFDLPVGAGNEDDDRLIKSWLDPNYVPDAIYAE